MGTPKALLSWKGRPLIAHQCEQLAGFRRVVVVVGEEADAIQAHIPPCEPFVVVVNTRVDEGRTISLELAAKHIPPECPLTLVAAVDQPLEASVVETLLEHFIGGEDHCLKPALNGRGGHPIALSAERVARLQSASDYPMGLRSVIEEKGARMVTVGSDAIFNDLNTPSDYQQAVKHISQAAREPSKGGS